MTSNARTTEVRPSQVKTWTSILLKLVIVVLVVWGLHLVSGGDSFMSAHTLLFFTVQSNLWIGGSVLILAVAQIVGVATRRDVVKQWMYGINFMFVVAITLTCLVMTFMLTPTMIREGRFMGLFTPSNLVPHYIVPIASVVDFLLFATDWRPKLRALWLSIWPPLYYVIFALVLGAQGVMFDGDRTFPYFFLDHESMGWFRGFQPDGPYGSMTLGVGWWIIILGVAIVLMGAVYFVLQRLTQRSRLARVPFSYQLGR